MVERKRSFNDKLMTFVAVPLVISWLTFACYVIYKGVNDETGAVQEQLDFYVALIAIIGGPALLFINSILGAWVAEQTAEQNALPTRLELEIEQAKASQSFEMKAQEADQKHKQTMEKAEQEYLHRDPKNLTQEERNVL